MSSAKPTLEELIDEVMTGNRYHALRIFNSKVMGHAGYTVSLCRNHSTCTVDTLSPEAKPSEKVRQILMSALSWADTSREQSQPKDEFDDVLG